MVNRSRYIIEVRNILLPLFLVFSFLITKPLFAQEQDFVIPDSLRGFGYEELEELFEIHINDKDIAEVYAKTYLKRGKLYRDTTNLVNGYLLLSRIFAYEEKGIQYADSMIWMSKSNPRNEANLAEAYFRKGTNQYYLGRYQESLDNNLKALEIYSKQNEPIQLIKIRHTIGLLYNEMDNNEDALKLFKENLKYLEIDSIKRKHESKYLITLGVLADTYNRLRKADSAKLYCSKGLHEDIMNKYKSQYNGLLLSYGIALFHQKKYNIAIDSLIRASNSIKNRKAALCDIYLIISESYENINRKEFAILYLKKIDSINKINPETYSQARTANKRLYDIYKNTNASKEIKLLTLDRIIYLDSIYNLHRKNLSKRIVQEYDIPNLIREKDDLLKTSKLSKQKLKIWLYIIFALSGIFSILTIYFYTRQKIYVQRYNQFVDEQNTVKDKPKAVPTTIEDISKENVERIIVKLDDFEVNLGFLDNNVTLNSLAQIFKTNTSYLSKVINFYKEKSFSSYINELRIDYFLEVLPHNTLFQNYSIKALAKEFGFNNPETFGKYFYAKTGFYPSFYIKQLKKQESETT